MREDKIKVQDLYEGAYLLCRGFELKDLTVIGNNGKAIVTFIIVGDDVAATAQEYRSGRATANVALLKFTMEKLKDQMFTKIRSASVPEGKRDYGETKNREIEQRNRRRNKHDHRRNKEIHSIS